MGKFLKISTLFIFLLSTVSFVNAQKFGYVNSAAILQDMPEVKQAESNLEALQKQLQKKGQSEMESLQKDYVAIQEKISRGELSPKQQEDEAKVLEERQKNIAKMEQDMINQINTKRAQLLDPISKKINDAIKAVAEENGFQFIFDQGVLLYADDTTDVSKMVRAKLGMQ